MLKVASLGCVSSRTPELTAHSKAAAAFSAIAAAAHFGQLLAVG